MTDDSLHITLALPCSWERRQFEGQATEALWQEGLLILRVINHMEGHAPRETDADARAARLEAKLDLALHLLARTLPAAAPCLSRLTLWAEGCSVPDLTGLTEGDPLLLCLQLSPALPLPLKLPAMVTQAGAESCSVRWSAMPEPVAEAWEQWLFRQHRRTVHEQRGVRGS